MRTGGDRQNNFLIPNQKSDLEKNGHEPMSNDEPPGLDRTEKMKVQKMDKAEERKIVETEEEDRIKRSG